MSGATASDRMTRQRWLIGLLVVSMLAAALMLIAAVNLDLVFALFSAHPQVGRPDTGLSNFLVPMVVGTLPFLVMATLIAWTVLGARTRTPADKRRQLVVDRLIVISGLGLPCIALFGFWSGLSAAAEELPTGSLAEAALTVYQFTFLSAILADAVTLGAAVAARTRG
jgi:hypothetical protein